MQQCQNITRKSASNLAMAFVLLPKAKRDGMSALYAFCREVDDAGDDESRPLDERRKLLADWRADIARACNGTPPHMPVNIELQPIARQYQLSFDLFDDLIRGVEMDLDIKRYETVSALEQYCYRVASVVGLLSIEIFGYKNRACKDYAVYLGKALQLTNILRDVQTDARLGRIYMPLEILKAHNVTEQEILDGHYSERYARAAADLGQCARQFFRLARQTLPQEDRRSMIAAELMGFVYWRLLLKLEKCRFNVFTPAPVRLNKLQKIILILRAWGDYFLKRNISRYGQ